MDRPSACRNREKIGGAVPRLGDEDHERFLADGDAVHEGGELAAAKK